MLVFIFSFRIQFRRVLTSKQLFYEFFLYLVNIFTHVYRYCYIVANGFLLYLKHSFTGDLNQYFSALKIFHCFFLSFFFFSLFKYNQFISSLCFCFLTELWRTIRRQEKLSALYIPSFQYIFYQIRTLKVMVVQRLQSAFFFVLI